MVSVIISTFSRADLIDRAVESVINQSYTDWELIIVDDNSEGSEDRKKLEDKMKKYEKNNKIIYIKHKKNLNGAAARNSGIKIAKGQYIAFLDDDDFFLKNRLEIMVKELEKDKSYDAVYSSVYVMYRGIYHALKSGNLQHDILMQKPIIGTGSNLFFRKKIFDKIGLFDESFQRHQDLEFLVRYFRYFKIKAVDIITVVKDDSVKRNNWPDMIKTMEYRKKYLETFMEDIKKYDDCSSIIDYNYFSIAKKSLDAKNIIIYNEAINLMSKITLKNKIVLIIHKKFHFLINLENTLCYFKTKNKLREKNYEEISNIIC